MNNLLIIHSGGGSFRPMEKREREWDIIDAARLRFGQYGFNKTTMAEIAGDCQMSAANIYRYFSGKKELLARIAQVFFREVEKDIAQVTVDRHLSPVEKITALVLTTLHTSVDHHLLSPKMNEVIDFICTERVDLILEHRQNKEQLLTGLLEGGVADGTFIPHDCRARAEAILNATVLVHPVFLTIHDTDYLHRSLKDIVNIMTEGLIRKS